MPIDFSIQLNRGTLRRVAAIVGAFTVAGLAYALLAPKWYRSAVTIVPAVQQRGGGGISSLLGGDLGGLAALGASLAGGSADASRIAAVLQSNAVSDAVIEKFDLRHRYDENYQETTRKELWRHCEVRTMTRPNLVELSCEDKEPAFVREMLTFFVENGNKVFGRVSVGSATEEVRFLEKRVAELRQQAGESAARMREFQEKYRIIDLETQAKAVIGSLAALNSQRISKQLELDYARTYSSGDEATTRQLESQLSIVRQKARDLEDAPPAGDAADAPTAKGAKHGKGSLFPAALEVPKLREEFENLYRDRKVSEAVLVFALERLEAARAAEARNVSTFQVLDHPALPDRHARPKRSIVIALFVLGGLAVAAGWEWLRVNRAGRWPFAATRQDDPSERRAARS